MWNVAETLWATWQLYIAVGKPMTKPWIHASSCLKQFHNSVTNLNVICWHWARNCFMIQESKWVKTFLSQNSVTLMRIKESLWVRCASFRVPIYWINMLSCLQITSFLDQTYYHRCFWWVLVPSQTWKAYSLAMTNGSAVNRIGCAKQSSKSGSNSQT